MKNIYNILLCAAASVMMFACSTEFAHSPYGENDGIAPGPVKVKEVINFNGGAYILYDLPSDTDIQYVKAVYNNSKNVEVSSTVSAYADTLKIEGLGDTKSRKVNIFTVDRYGNESTPVTTTIEPLEPSVIAAFSSLNAETSFGGFVLDFVNVMRDPLSFYVYQWNEESSEWVLTTVKTTSMSDGTIQFKGYDAVLTKFAIEVRDSWGNVSDKYEFELTPIFEVELDKKKFSPILNLYGDTAFTAYSGSVAKAFDGILNGGNNWAHTAYPVTTGWPHSFTFDLGTSAKISEFAIWPRQDNEDFFFAHGFPHHFALLGCPADKDYRDLGNYITLFDGYTERPSGTSFGDPLTAEDIQICRDGLHFTLDPSETPVPVRYIKFTSYMSWSGMDCTVISEITLWGSPED